MDAYKTEPVGFSAFKPNEIPKNEQVLAPPRSRSNHTSRLVLTAVALAVSMSMSLSAQAANTDYSNQTLDHGIDVIGAGNSISALFVRISFQEH